MFVDSHCHINSDDFDNDRLQVVQRAREMKVEYILDVSDDIKKTPEIIDSGIFAGYNINEENK